MGYNGSKPGLYFYLCSIKSKPDDYVGWYSSKDVGVASWSKDGFLLITQAPSVAHARKKLKTFIRHNIRGKADILPFLADFQDLRAVLSKIRLQTKVMHNINVMQGNAQLDTKRLSLELNRVIQQNDKWSRELKGLRTRVKDYVDKPSADKKHEILKMMFKLNIRPDGIVT